ncbi:MAG: hypothetical protein IJ722_07745 [Alloprevotella sp.]|nr:hypothetical protein [Alloprevotella sp.]
MKYYLGLRKRLGRIPALLTLLAAFCAQTAWAEDFVEDVSNYTFSYTPPGTITFNMPVYEQAGIDSWVYEGYVYAQPEGGAKVKVFHWYASDTNIDDDATTMKVKMECCLANGIMVYKRRDGNDFNIDYSEGTYEAQVTPGTVNFGLKVEWFVPWEMRGKRVEMSYEVKMDYNSSVYPKKTLSIPTNTFTLEAAPQLVQPQVMDPILAFESAHSGQVMVPWVISANNITQATAHWKNLKTGGYESRELKHESSDFMYFDAYTPATDFYIEVKYKVMDGSKQIEIPQAQQSSPRRNIPILHVPQNLYAKTDNQGNVKVTWSVEFPKHEDIMPTDYFEVQRNMTDAGGPNDAGWVSVGMVNYADGQELYEFEDKTVLAAYNNRTIHYRVRRAASSSWGWTEQAGYKDVSLTTIFMLPAIKTATVTKANNWGQENVHKADLVFSFTEASPDSIKEIPGHFVLKNAADWEELAKLVAADKEVDVYMMNDIDLAGSQTMLGSSEHPFQGTFNGCGHTLTVNYNASERYCAPFRYTRDAAIGNLAVKGSITSSQKFAAGVVGTVTGGSVKIQSCQVSATITSTLSGDATNGGFVAHVGYASLYVTDCLFDGTMKGAINNGGIIGWVEASTGNETKLTRVTFEPKELSDGTGCQTFARHRAGAKLSLTDCYFTRKYGELESTQAAESYYILRTKADWDNLAILIYYANGAKVNAILDSDIDGLDLWAAGDESSPFRGTFDGNGHTLTFDIDQFSQHEYIAPFRHVMDATIKDLTIKGRIKAGKYAAGLVGNLVDASRLRLERCRVSADINFADYGGGFVGAAHEADIYMYDCLFDGKGISLTTNATSNFYAFIGDGYGIEATIDACLERGSYENVTNKLMVYKRSGFSWFHTTRCGSYTFTLPNIGQYVGNKSASEVLSMLENGNWRVEGNTVVPITKSPVTIGQKPQMENITTLDKFITTVWDSRAKLTVLIKKYAGGELRYTERRELTDEERAAGKVTLELNTSCVDYAFDLLVERNASPLQGANTIAVTKTEHGAAASYEFSNRGTITKAITNQQQASVQLTWETDDGDIDYFHILRRDKSSDPKLPADTVASQYLQLTYIDRNVQPQHLYTYTIVGVTQCEGEHTTNFSVDGQCATTGMVSGYVRMVDGTAIADKQVTATPIDIKGAVKQTVYTDSVGYFIIDGLIYQGEGSYTLSVGANGDESPYKDIIVTFDGSVGGNMVSNLVFTQSQYFTFSGQVIYDGSSIPVVGAQFRCDGKTVMNAKGKPFETDTQGRFSISVPQGSHSVQVVKDGHVFMEDGFYTDPNAQAGYEQKPNWQGSRSGHVFWDKTKVVLHGRVVGGNDQGLLPLGKSLSRNNLGDELTITMQLEGDNASWIVRDQLDELVKERDLTFTHGVNDTTRVHMTRRTITIHPDPKTGEYQLELYPVKYKVTEIYATGYPTLFASGMVAETVDLTACTKKDTATYNRIYHTPATLHYEQMNIMPGDSYFGLKSYTAIDVAGTRAQVSLWDKEKGYAFGYPVFMAGSPIPLLLSAREEYFYNNVLTSVPDVVKLGGGEVKLQNGLVSSTETVSIPLDSIGEGTYVFTPSNLTFTQEGTEALRTLSITLLYDGTHYDITPLRGYVLASQAKPQGRRVVSDGGTYLIDILRDPPGGGSSAYIEAGSKLSYSFNCDVTAEAGVNLDFSLGSGSNFYTGLVAVATEAGTINSTKNVLNTSLPITVGYYNSWQYNYNFETTERISTSSNTKNVGADADVYIGMTQNAIVEDAVAVRVVPASMYQYLMPRESGQRTINGHTYNVKNGAAKVLARGTDATGDSVYLIRDEVLQMYMKLQSTFAHSQTYILNELIPTLLNVRSTLMLPPGTSHAYAQQVADRQGHPVYISLLPEDDPNYTGRDDTGKPTYIQVKPSNSTWAWGDSIRSINQQILTWAGFIAQNEQEKLEARDLVKSYDFDGRTALSYNETFSVGLAEGRYLKFPFSSLSGSALAATVPIYQSSKGGIGNGRDENGRTLVEFEAAGYSFSMGIKPVMSINFNHKFGQTENYSKKVGFTLSMDRASSLAVDVYRTSVDLEALKKQAEEGDLEIFTVLSQDYIDAVKNGKYTAAGVMMSYLDNATPQYRNFVYRTRAGATTSPWEDERRTKFYSPGTLLDVRTLDIDRPAIWAEQSSISNVPHDEPARFTIYLANESEVPASSAPNKFYIKLEDAMNPKGAKVQIDGNTLAGEGHFVYIPTGQTVTKQVEVYAGADFDYENIGIGLINKEDPERVFVQKLSAHFIPTAGKVNISQPGDKWVMNTESQLDTIREQYYYMPVVIDGFNVNYPGFDHIELQYKLSNQGDKEWVNVCSFYSDSLLMAKASGMCEFIKDEGRIVANFYGEADPIEQQYDLRAVNYCRYGNGFLTRSSDILSGIKDTRRPQLFGTPKPEDGILGIGDDIILRFSEQIAGNYLRDLNNFQVLGQTNSSNITLSTNLRFNGQSQAVMQGARNLSAKSFTVDVMLNPVHNGKAMSFLAHGEEGGLLELGLTADHHLTAAIAQSDTTGTDRPVYTSTEPVSFNGLHQVSYVFESDIEKQQTTIRFYDGTKKIGESVYPNLYEGYGHVLLGQGNGLIPGNGLYEGEMLEFRLWNRALSTAEISDYALKRLTGYELGLLDNYPLNEGKGDYSYNRVGSGSDLILLGASWKVPDGIGMKLDGVGGFRLKPEKFQRQAHQDYTLMFWFRTHDYNGTLLANGRAEDETNARQHFNFNVMGGTLNLNLSGLNVITNSYVSDGAWHHAALTVCRSRNVGCLYLDQKLCKTFAVDTLGGISGNYLAAGATHEVSGVSRPIQGNIDEIAMFEMALTRNTINEFANATPTGEEMGLLAYLNFSQNELQMNNQQRLMPTGVSLKRYKDMTTGKLSAQRDTIVSQDVVERFADRELYAPMHDTQSLENINYSFVADGKDLLINLDVPDERIEKTNVYIVVQDVADMQGNLMASPVAMDLYVYRNPLRWNVKHLALTPNYGEEYTFEATIENLSGKARHYTLEGLPLWITASKTSGSVGALDEETITFTLSPYINIGNFDEIISLVDDEGMNEPLPISIKVRGEAPDWAVDQALLRDNITMNVIARVEIGGRIMSDPADRLAVFGEGHRTLGVAKLDADPNNADGGIAYLTIYNSTTEETQLRYEFYDASTGNIHVLLGAPEVSIFRRNAVVGTPAAPYVFSANNGVVQTLHLHDGWNWISFNVMPERRPVGELLNNATKWDVGDGLEVVRPDGTYAQISYKQFYNTEDPKNPLLAWDEADKVVELDPQQMYRFYSHSEKTAYISGYSAFESLTVKPGWNRIGYLSHLNLPVGTALADYTDRAAEGDIIKSQSEFAILTVDVDGNKTWRGTLQYMQTGEGYMLKRNTDSEATFNYPYYLGQSRYNGGVTKPAYVNTSGTSMTVVAKAKGITTEEGDILTAYRGAEVCGVAVANAEGTFFLNIGDTDAVDDELSFTLERDEEIIGQAVGCQMQYAPNAALGTPANPTAISFARSSESYGEGWYTVSGIRLHKQPRETGVYIHNNEKVIIK